MDLYLHLRRAEAAIRVDLRVGRGLGGSAAGAAAAGHIHLGHLLVRVVVVVVVVVHRVVVVIVRNGRLATLRRNLTGQGVERVEHFHRDTCPVQLGVRSAEPGALIWPYRYLSPR